jgi:hypothetical protein
MVKLTCGPVACEQVAYKPRLYGEQGMNEIEKRNTAARNLSSGPSYPPEIHLMCVLTLAVFTGGQGS